MSSGDLSLGNCLGRYGSMAFLKDDVYCWQHSSVMCVYYSMTTMIA